MTIHVIVEVISLQSLSGQFHSMATTHAQIDIPRETLILTEQFYFS
jgi:hypothetical protein